ncbi:hypothetical protein Tco_1374860 [Tanacetum coccineum]
MLASRVLTLEQRCADLEKKHKLQDKTTQALSSRIFTLELKYLPHKINCNVNEVKRANQDEFLAKKDKSQKRRCDDQDPPPPPPDSDLSKKKRHDTGISCQYKTRGSSSPVHGKTSDTREAPSSSSKQKFEFLILNNQLKTCLYQMI